MKAKKLFSSFLLISGILLIISGCQLQSTNGESQQPQIKKAICVIHPTQGDSVSGLVTFTMAENGIKVVADLQGLTPGKHGFHIHQYGDCSDPSGKSAGGHFNPAGTDHGGPDDIVRHEGDLGNITAGENGKAHLERVDKMIKLNGTNSIIGRAIIVHAGEDDLKSQPTGNAGARVACGVIGIAKSMD